MGAYSGPTNGWLNLSSSNAINGLVTNGLVLALDVGRTLSYPGSGTTWTDLSGNGNNGTLTNGPTYSTDNLGSLNFDGIDDYVSLNSNFNLGSVFSISLWIKHSNTNVAQEKYITLGSDRIIIQEDINQNLNLYVSDGTQKNLWLWGNNDYQNLGINDTLNRSTPVTTFAGGTNWKLIDCGWYHTAAIKTDGTLWTWGRNGYGQLGNATSSTISTSTPVTTFAGGTNWKSVSCGGNHTIAIKTDGTLWTWGANGSAQLGNNVRPTAASTPVTTFAGGTNWKSINSGLYFITAIKSDGTLWLWGSSDQGQLGVNDLVNRNTPITTIVGGTNWKSVYSGNAHIAAIKTDGTLWTWGYNNAGQLGTNDFEQRNTPVTTFVGGTNWKYTPTTSIAGFYVGAIKEDGTLWMWGSIGNGKLATNDTTPNRSTPVTTFIGGTNWKTVSCGQLHTSAVKTDGTLWVWGSNPSGDLGINDTTNRSTPVTTFLGGTNWKDTASAYQHNAAIKTNATFITDISVIKSVDNSNYYNIAVTCDGTTLTLYKNGNLISTTSLGGTLNTSSLSCTISSAIEAFGGNLSSVQVYNRVLSSSEIQQNFNAVRRRFGV